MPVPGGEPGVKESELSNVRLEEGEPEDGEEEGTAVVRRHGPILPFSSLYSITYGTGHISGHSVWSVLQSQHHHRIAGWSGYFARHLRFQAIAEAFVTVWWHGIQSHATFNG
jgi:hypothetical protein